MKQPLAIIKYDILSFLYGKNANSYRSMCKPVWKAKIVILYAFYTGRHIADWCGQFIVPYLRYFGLTNK